jgi:hypothetical protein
VKRSGDRFRFEIGDAPDLIFLVAQAQDRVTVKNDDNSYSNSQSFAAVVNCSGEIFL